MMTINGPFTYGVDYLGNVEVTLSPSNPQYVIDIVDPDINKYKYLYFKFKQPLQRLHSDTVFVFLSSPINSTILPVKPTPTRCGGFIEYRVRLSSEYFSGQPWGRITFLYGGVDETTIQISGLFFGPTDEGDSVILPTGFLLHAKGGGITSPIMGYIPVAPEEVVTINFIPYSGAILDKVLFHGSLYDESGNKYPEVFIPPTINEIKVKFINSFESCQVIAKFKRFQ